MMDRFCANYLNYRAECTDVGCCYSEVSQSVSLCVCVLILFEPSKNHSGVYL